MREFEEQVRTYIARLANEQAVLVNDMCLLPKDSLSYHLKKLGVEVAGLGIVIYANFLNMVDRDRILEAFNS